MTCDTQAACLTWALFSFPQSAFSRFALFPRDETPRGAGRGGVLHTAWPAGVVLQGYFYTFRLEGSRLGSLLRSHPPDLTC